MVRRCPAPLTMLAAALAFGLGSRPMSTRANGLTNSSNTSNTPTVTADYTLSSSISLAAPTGSKPAPGDPNPPTPQFTAVVNPVGVFPVLAVNSCRKVPEGVPEYTQTSRISGTRTARRRRTAGTTSGRTRRVAR